jgi:transposase
MEESGTTLNRRDRRRLSVVRKVQSGQLTVKEAAEALELSERQMWRIMAAYRERAAASVPHGNRGRTPSHALREEVRRKVTDLATSRYAGCTHRELQDLLRTHEGISISRSSVRNILAEAGIRTRRGRRPGKGG